MTEAPKPTGPTIPTERQRAFEEAATRADQWAADWRKEGHVVLAATFDGFAQMLRRFAQDAAHAEYSAPARDDPDDLR
jgi:hypothetical protein